MDERRYKAFISYSHRDERCEPLAADIRRYNDGRHIGLLKVVAGILGIRLDELRRRDASAPVIFLTAHGSVERAVEALKLGAFDFVSKPVDLPVLADCQLAALVCGAHPYKIVQSHWHASSTETLMEKLGIDWQAKKAEFEAYLKDVEAGKGETLYDPRKMITSGPGFKPLEKAE